MIHPLIHTNMTGSYDGMDHSLFWDDDFMMDDGENSQLNSQVSFGFEEDINVMFVLDNQEDKVEGDVDSGEETEQEDSSIGAIEGIENLVLSLLTQLSLSLLPTRNVDDDGDDDTDEPETSTLKKPKARKVELKLADRRKVTSDGSMGTRAIRYPQKAKPLAQLFRVLDITHEALITGIPATKRDMYYKDVPLFRKQAVVDRLIDDLAATFELDRSDLNVRAASKGLVCGGGLVIHLLEGEIIHANDSEGTLIPVGEDISRFEVDDDIAWVLIVEKEAIFQTLCRLKLANHPSLPGPGIIITGKGYPDIATRQLVKTLAHNLPTRIPILALVDGDAYGLDILSVYKNGSTGMRHENDKLAADRIEWLGVWASELAEYIHNWYQFGSRCSSKLFERLNIDRDALIHITKYDEKKAYSMLQRNVTAMPAKWRKELMHMLHTRRKAEIEILSTAKLTQPPRLFHATQPMDITARQTSPFLGYLLDKILHFVDASASCKP